MQIHELDYFSGDINNAFAVVDDGMDTGKITPSQILQGVNQAIDTTNERIDNIISGVTTDTEVIDARQIGTKTYSTLHAALNAEFGDIKNDLIDNNSHNLVFGGDTTSKTHNSTTFTWASDKRTCAVKCTSNNHSVSLFNIYYSPNALPDGFVPGNTYYLKYKSTVNSGQRVVWDLYIYLSDNTQIQYATKTSDLTFVLPANAIGIHFRLRVIANYVVDEIVTISLLTAKTNIELGDETINAMQNYGLADYVYSNGTHNGITYTWNADNNRIKVKGTASGNSFRNIFYDATNLPQGINAGDKVGVLCRTTDEHIAFRVTYALDDGTNSYSSYFSEPTFLTIPNNAIGLFLRINVVNGYTVDGWASLPLFFKTQTQVEKIPFKAKKPLMVSFIDDDTSTDSLVTKFYQNCKHNGIVGSFAVCTKQYIEGTSTIAQLLSYEYDGFNLIPHCTEQQTYLQPTSPDYDIVRTRENYFQCLRDFITLGIRNPQNLWIIPYGSQDEATANLAKDLGFDMAFTTMGLVNNYLTWSNKFGMHRCGLSALADVTDDTDVNATGSMAKCKARIDELVASETGGWAIFTTHFNEWGTETWDATLDANGYEKGYTRFNELVQYAISSGCDIVSMAQGAAYMKPIIDRNFTMG